MALEKGFLDLFGNKTPAQGSVFDINILPMNLSEGRNIGDLSGLFVFTPPQKAGNNRQNDILFLLFYVDNLKIPNTRMKQWAVLLSESYYASRGSFTMGMSSAVKKLAAYIEKESQGQIMPTIFMNAAALRERNLMIAHAGPVHSAIISSDKVQNFNNESCLPIQLKNNELSFFTADVHSEDIVLLCPKVPADWTNSAILEVTGDSPLNAIRFLLDRSGGNLQAAVIQLKRGKGQITIRSKTAITANVEPENASAKPVSNIINRPMTEVPSEEKPLFRKRNTAEIFGDRPAEQPNVQQEEPPQNAADSDKTESEEKTSLTGEQELPGAEALPYDFSETEPAEKTKQSERSVSAQNRSKRKQPAKSRDKTGKKFNFKRFAVILLCGILIPVIVVSVLFFIYSGRSNDQLHREYLTYAVAAAQKALIAESAKSQETLWMETLDYTDRALNYGSSPAANDLRKEAINKLDTINGGISTVYSYANNNKLPQGLNITEIQASGQYTYALDSTSGSVMRFTAGGNGFTLDNSFTCTPGTYPELGSEEKTSVQVGSLVDFIMLPAGNPHSFVLAGVDKNANVLYCSGFKGNQAGKLRKPETGRFEIKSIAFSNNAMYILDPQASAVWEFLFSSSDGFAYEPSNYYGSYSPYLSDVIDFTMYKEYSYFLRESGTLLVCDYTGYRPVCSSITEVWSPDRKAYLNLENHEFKKVLLNSSPDNSLYIMDAKLQSILNLSTKSNFIRYIVPNRTVEAISMYSNASAFGITGQNRLLWGYKNDLYIGNMP